MRAVQSILSQSYRNYELIIVDDASTDNTCEVVKTFTDGRISFLQHELPCGASAARNSALRVCRGQYIAFMDDDDEWFSTKLEKQMMVFSKAPPEVGVVYTAFRQINNGSESHAPLKNIPEKEGDVHAALLEGNFITLPSVIIRKECLEVVGLFDEQMPRLQDWDLFIRLSKKYHFIFIDEPLLIVHHSRDSISADDTALAEAMELILQKNFTDIEKDAGLLVKYYGIIGNQMISVGQMRKARSYFIEALKRNPWKIKFSGAVLVTFLGQSVYSAILKMYQKIKRFR
jgi:glycosyltransferase involved in cell wall biosynthesis